MPHTLYYIELIHLSGCLYGAGTGALFHGKLSTELPADRSAIHSGYCAIRAKPMKVRVCSKNKGFLPGVIRGCGESVLR